MSKKTVYECDICGGVTRWGKINKFKRTTYHWNNWPDCWSTKKFDICQDCLNLIRSLIKEKEEVK